MKKSIIICIAVFCSFWSYGQEQIDVFSTSRIINGHSTKTLEKGILEFRVEHKFGDMFGQNGGIDQFFGLDVSSDIRIAFEYGLSDHWMIGLGRNKGAGPITGLLDGFVKYEMMKQKSDNSNPFSIAFLAGSLFSYARTSSDLTNITSYPEFRHRLTYTSQIILARQFFDRIGIALSPTYVHRNLVTPDDLNGLFSLGASAQYRITDKLGLIVEYYHNLDNDFRTNNYSNSFSGAIEWRTFGHVFSLYLSNARGFTEGQFIPYTPGNWLDGAFRAGFAIVRKFEL
jgi:hypothetical protein